jgi:hypothetical protein
VTAQLTSMTGAVRRCTRILWPGMASAKTPRGVIPFDCLKYRRTPREMRQAKTCPFAFERVTAIQLHPRRQLLPFPNTAEQRQLPINLSERPVAQQQLQTPRKETFLPHLAHSLTLGGVRLRGRIDVCPKRNIQNISQSEPQAW